MGKSGSFGSGWEGVTGEDGCELSWSMKAGGAMAREYVESKNGGYYIAETRISLDSIVYLYRDGGSPETIQDEFPSLSLEQIHGAIAFYLANRDQVDANIREGEAELDRLVPPLEKSHPQLHGKLLASRLIGFSR